VLSTRGAVLAAGAAAAAVAGLVYGVEEFVFLAMAVGILLAFGALSAWHRQRLSRRALRLVMRVPVAEVTARQSAVVELSVTNLGAHRQPPVLVEASRGHWSVSHPGLGEGSLAGARRSPASGTGAPQTSGTGAQTSRTGAQTSGTGAHRQGTAADGWWLGGGGSRPNRRQRAEDRRAVAVARRLPDLGPGADVTLSISVPTTTRGLLTLSDIGLWCEDPFRLVARRVTVAPPAHVIVFPVPAHVTVERASGAHPGGRERSSTLGTPNALSGDELNGLRPYAPGDRLTRLHWPSLARSGELVVRDFVEPQAGSLTLLVDLRPSAHSADSVEPTIARAAGYGVAALAQGLTVELCTSTGDRVVIAPGPAGHLAMLRAMALLGPANPPAAVARRWGNRPTGGAVWATGSVQGAEVVLVTTATGAAERTLPETLRRHTDMVLVP
jgi:uncharacterized protein (DUF58 family)